MATPGTPQDAERRAFWTSQLDAAYAFMQRMFEYPVEECGEPVVPLPEAASAAGVTVRFSETAIAGVFPRLYVLRRGLVGPFVDAAREMNRQGWVMKVEDGYRTTAMQRRLSLAPYVLDNVLAKVLWECGGQVPSADLFFRRLMVLTATAPKIGTHMSASAIDISVLRLDDLAEVDRGGPYLDMSERTPMATPFVPDAARQNRLAITAIMRRHGFVAYPYEFWHYNQGDAYDQALNETGKPARYGAVSADLATGQVTPVPDPCVSLHPPADFQRAMDEALERLRRKAQPPR